ncbi:unnamed protein product [Amaranthus hypochondriacus]
MAILQDPLSTRPPLLRSERGNGGYVNSQRRIRAREVPSRYMSMSSPSNSNSSLNNSTTTSTNTNDSTNSTSSSSISRRFPSPVVSRNNGRSLDTSKRSQSVDRTRSGTPKPTTIVGNGGEISAATKLLVTLTEQI